VVSIGDDNARLAALRSGQADYAPVRLDQAAAYDSLVSSGKLTKHVFGQQIQGLLLNTRSPGLSDPRVRLALSLAVDRSAINKALFNGGGAPAYQVYPAGLPGHVAALEKDPYNPGEARRLLAEARFPHLSIKVNVPRSEPVQSVATILQAQYAQIGVTLNIQRIQQGDPGCGAAFETMSTLLAREPPHIPVVQVPLQGLASPRLHNVDMMVLPRFASLVDARPLAKTVGTS
jgi:ABC-type transport system substrate-binding protein